MEIKMNKEEKGKKEATLETPVEAKAKTNSEDSKKVHAFLVQKGKDGALASDIAIHLGFMAKDADVKSPEYKAACKKVRKIARDVVDGDDKGSRVVRNGRQKVYQIV